MAANLKNENERLRRIVMVGEYTLETGESYRKVAEYFSKSFFPISYVTVSDYLVRYKKLLKDPAVQKSIDEIVKNNSEKTLELKEVRDRVYEVVSLFKSGLTIEEISEELKLSFWIIYRDLNSRYRLIDEDDYKNNIVSLLKENKENNLRKK